MNDWMKMYFLWNYGGFHPHLVDGFKHFLFSPWSLGKWFPISRAYFSIGLVQPPTSFLDRRLRSCIHFLVWSTWKFVFGWFFFTDSDPMKKNHDVEPWSWGIFGCSPRIWSKSKLVVYKSHRGEEIEWKTRTCFFLTKISRLVCRYYFG